MVEKPASSFVAILVPFLVLQNSKLPLQMYQVYLRRPTCLAGWRLLLLTVGGVVHVVFVVSLPFSWPQGGGSSSHRPQLGLIRSRGGCCWFLGSLVGVVCEFALSFSLLMEFLFGRRCSNCGLGCFPFGSARFDNCVQLV
jgi:hypothetical protein